MSQTYYNKMWRAAMKDLDTQLQKEKETFLQPEKDHMKVFNMLATSYIKYIQIFRNLEETYNELIHQQKRTVIRQVLDGVIGRILEIKKEMVKLEHSEFNYITDILKDLMVLPQDMEVPIPRYFIKENLEILQQREKMLDEILHNAGLPTEEPVKAMTSEEAIKIIQVAERARQGRAEAAFMKKFSFLNKRERQTKLQVQTGLSQNDAAICIQKVWRGYIQRKKTKKMREEEMIFLGVPDMEVPITKSLIKEHLEILQQKDKILDEILRNAGLPTESSPPCLQAMSVSQMYTKQVNALQGEVQERHEEVFQDKLREMEEHYIKETLQDQISQWFSECRHITGEFPDYPTKEAGGLTAVLSEKIPEQVTEELAAQNSMKLQEIAKKGKKEKEEEKEKMKGKKPQKTAKNEEGWKMAPSNCLSIIEEGNRQYKAVWQNREERWDFLQDHDPELIKQKKREEVEEEIRVQVDESMRERLKNLRLAVGEEKSGKQEKRGKGKKKLTTMTRKIPEIEEDLTPDRTIDSLYRELVEEGLLIKAKTVNLSNYLGDYNYLGSIHRQRGEEPLPCPADVRQLIALYAILPLGSQTVHEKAPLVKSLLLAGPAGTGKKMLVHAICTETGANLFSLSASNITGKYPEKSDLKMMLNMVLKVAKQLQPSVVWIGDTEQIFIKVAPKAEEQTSPKQLEKMLTEFLNALTAQDRVLLVGTTNRPFDANLEPFCRFYQKIILIPKPDYYSRYVLWKHSILENGGAITWLHLCCLTKISDGFTQGSIIQAVQAVLTTQRLLQMTTMPLKPSEFIDPLSRQDFVYREEEEAFQAWYAKTPWGRARIKALADSKKAEEEKKEGNKRKKK